MTEKISNFFYKFKKEDLEAKEIIEYKDIICDFAMMIRESDYFKEIYTNYLLIRGYTHRLEDANLRLYYTFKEAIYAIDLAQLTQDEEGIKLNSAVYIVVIADCISEFLELEIDEEEKEEALIFYKKEEEKKAKENKKYHMYQN